MYCIHTCTTNVDITVIDYVIDRSHVVEYSRDFYCMFVVVERLDCNC